MSRGGPTDPSHDERLRRGVIDTAVSRPVAGAIVGVFLLQAVTIGIVAAAPAAAAGAK